MRSGNLQHFMITKVGCANQPHTGADAEKVGNGVLAQETLSFQLRYCSVQGWPGDLQAVGNVGCPARMSCNVFKNVERAIEAF